LVGLSERERLSLLHDGITQSLDLLKRCKCERFSARDTGENLRGNANWVDSFNAVNFADSDSYLHDLTFRELLNDGLAESVGVAHFIQSQDMGGGVGGVVWRQAVLRCQVAGNIHPSGDSM